MHRPHPLATEFAAEAEIVERLRRTDADFAKIADRYDEVDREIGAIDARETPRSETDEKVLREHRAALRDAIASRLRAERLTR